MSPESALARCYAALLRLYPRTFRARFGEPMAQTFADLCRERHRDGRALWPFVLRTFAETAFTIVEENLRSMVMWNRNIVRIAAVTGLLLLIPFIAMQFTPEVNWTASDFVFAGALIFGTGLAYELIARRGGWIYRLAVALALFAAFALIWVNAAVGIIGSEHNPANELYGGVLLVGVVGAAIARLHARGMSNTLFAMAVAQLLVPAIALVFWRTTLDEPPGLVGTFVLNAMFAGLMASSGLLFRRAAMAVA
jgi:hypothetical protein